MAVSTQIFTAEKPAFSRSQSCLTYFNFILNICNIKINRSRRYLPNPTYVRLKRDFTRVIRFLAPTFRRLLFKLNSSCLPRTFSVVPFSLSRRHGELIFLRDKSSQHYYRSPLWLPAASATWKLVVLPNIENGHGVKLEAISCTSASGLLRCLNDSPFEQPTVRSTCEVIKQRVPAYLVICYEKTLDTVCNSWPASLPFTEKSTKAV